MFKKTKYILLNPSRGLQFTYICVYRLLLDYIYCSIVSPMYSYAGLTLNYSVPFYIISWAMLVIYTFLSFLLLNKQKCGAIVLSILLICSAIPTTTIVAFLNVNINFVILNLIYWCFLVFLYSLKAKPIKLNIFKIRRYNMIVYFIFSFFAFIVMFIYVRYSVQISFDLYNVYDKREAFKGANVPTILRYLFAACIIIFPIILVYALNIHNKILVVLSATMQLCSFMVDGRKSTFFVMIAILIGYYLITDLTAKMVPVLIMGITVLSMLEKILFGTIFLINFVIRRLFIITAYLQFAYYDYFHAMPKDLFRQGIMGRLGFVSPYEQSIPTIVGGKYYIGSYANNGLFADAYANLGVLGVFILPILIVLAMKMLDGVSKGLKTGTCMGIILVASYTFISSSFFTVMLTHGFFLGCLIIFLIPRFGHHKLEQFKNI